MRFRVLDPATLPLSLDAYILAPPVGIQYSRRGSRDGMHGRIIDGCSPTFL